MTKHTSHTAQLAILHQLLHSRYARFAQLRQATDLSSDHFNFHITKLVEKGYIQKRSAGDYELTNQGKEYANQIDAESFLPVRQPKVSVLLNVERYAGEAREFLVQKRLKQPHYGFYGRISGKVKWGESFEAAARRILYDETGLTADFSFVMIHRKMDYAKKTGLIEDKLFVVMRANNSTGKLQKQWSGGENMWMKPAKFLELDPADCFASARTFMTSPEDSAPYRKEMTDYSSDQY